MAIILKDLLSVLDQVGVKHLEEGVMRRVLRARKDVDTSKNQRFSLSNSTDATMKHFSCIIIPKDDVPQSFFEKLSKGT